MGSLKRLVATVALVLFVGALVLRPLFSNPALSTVFSDGSLSRGTLLAVPLFLVTLLLVAARVRSIGSDTGHATDTTTRTGPSDERTGWNGGAEGETATDRETTTDSEEASEIDVQLSTDQRNFLSGQGGTRNKEFEIEEEPPEAALNDHFEHLQTELDGADRDLEKMAEVVEEVESETVPERCPQPHCDAAWTERTMFGVGNGKYERLDGGDRVQCLECEQIVALE